MILRELATLVVGNTILSSSELSDQISSSKRQILKIAANIDEGIFVPIIVDNSISSHIAVLAAAEIGIDVAIIDSKVTDSVLSKILQNLNSPVGIIANPEFKVGALTSNTSFLQLQPESRTDQFDHANHFLKGSVIVYSSGSTGDPKGVILRWDELIKWTKIRTAIDGIDDKAQRTVLNISPVSWLLGLLNLLSVLLGARLVTLNPNQFSPNQLLLEIQKHQPNQISLTANLAKILGSAAKEWQLGQVESIHSVMIGSGRVKWETVNLFSDFIPTTATFTHNLSATEAFRMFEMSVAFGEIPTYGQVPIGLPRFPENLRLELTDKVDVFEVFASGHIATGYINKKKSIEAFSIDNQGKTWWKSGELVRLDRETGSYFHVGRIDNMIKVNDHNVLLDEIEGLIQEHPEVKMTTVLPVEIHERIRIIAFVSLTNSNSQTNREISNHLRASLPSYALPHKVVNLHEFPLTRSGKIDRAAMLIMAAAQLT